MNTFNAAKANEKKKRSTYEKFKNSVGQEEVEEEPLLVWIICPFNWPILYGLYYIDIEKIYIDHFTEKLKWAKFWYWNSCIYF